MRRLTLAVAAILAGLAVAPAAWAAPSDTGPSSAASGHAPGDPYERANRVGYAVHQVLDRLLLRPAALTYKALIPGPMRTGVRHVLDNLDEPVVVLNDLFQGHPGNAGRTTVRFAVNSTLGVLGIFDVAGKTGLPHRDNSFAFTLGRHHVKPGPFLFIPLLGPTTVRDLFGGAVDGVLDPFHWIHYRYRNPITVARAVVGGLDLRANADDDLKALTESATDPYATLRSVYLQNQQSQIDGGDTTSLPALPDFDEPAAPSLKPDASPSTPSPNTPASPTTGSPGETAPAAPAAAAPVSDR